MLKQFLCGEFGFFITDNPESLSVLFEPQIDDIVKIHNHDRTLFKTALDSLLLQHQEIRELSHSLGPKLSKEIMTDIDWLLDYLDGDYAQDYKFNLQEEGWVIKNEK